MSQARDAILTKLRAGNWSSPAPKQAATGGKPGPLPKLGADRLAYFEAKLKNNVISSDRVSTAQGIADSVVGFFQQHQIPLQLCAVSHPLLKDLPWPATLSVKQGPVANKDLSVISVAAAAIAESGSVVMLSSAETPTEANFLPDNFVCIVEASMVFAHMEDLWAWQRTQTDKPPAVINIISGPSRTADVEQTIQLGAHGPRRMHVIIKV